MIAMFISDLKRPPFLNQCPPARSPGPEPRLRPALLCLSHTAPLQGVGEALLERETTFRMSEKRKKKKKKTRRIFPWMDRNAIIKKSLGFPKTGRERQGWASSHFHCHVEIIFQSPLRTSL